MPPSPRTWPTMPSTDTLRLTAPSKTASSGCSSPSGLEPDSQAITRDRPAGGAPRRMASGVGVGTRASCAGRPPLPPPRREDLAETFGIFAQPCGSHNDLFLASSSSHTVTPAMLQGPPPASVAFQLPARRKLSARPELPRSAWLAAASIVRGRPGSGSRTACTAAGEDGRQDLGHAAQPLPSRLRHSAGKQGVAGWRDQLAAKGR